MFRFSNSTCVNASLMTMSNLKTAINEEDPDKMRLQPIGRDKDGLMYWFQLDQDHNVRVYVEEQDDLDGSILEVYSKVR